MRLMRKDEMLRFIADRRHVFDAEAQNNPFASSAWLVHFIEQVAASDWTFIIAESALDPGAFMLLYRTSERPQRALAVANYYASLYSPVVGVDIASSRTTEVVRDLRRVSPTIATVDLSPLDGHERQTIDLCRSFSRAGWYARRYFCFGNWFLPSQNLTFADYMAARPSQLRNTWTRKAKRFDGGSARLELVTSGARAADGIDAFRQVYGKSWKKPEPYPDFVPGWAKICSENGWLRLGIAWLNDQPIAVQFWFTRSRRAYIFKLAYDEKYAKLSAGTVLTAFMIRHSLEQDQVVEIDYLTGDDVYKRDWMAARRERVGVRACYLGNVRGIAMAAVEAIGAGKKLLHRASGRQAEQTGR